MNITELPARHLFFTGKGGVGKTSLSCATGIALAGQGLRVLIVSTDPASNLDEVLGVELSGEPQAIPGVLRLSALNIDPEAAARDYRERMVGPYRGILPPAAIASMEEQFSGACTVEIAAFDEFSALLGNPDKAGDYDRIIFDTAPTGHTLRLLSLPSAWSGYIESSTGGASCLGPLAGLEQQRSLYAATVAQLADASQTAVVLVTRPEMSALREAERTRGELAGLGICHLVLAVNGLLQANPGQDAVALAMAKRMEEAMASMPAGLRQLPCQVTPLVAQGMVGIAALASLLQPSAAEVSIHSAAKPNPPLSLPGLNALVDALEQGGHGVVMAMGKGGVGKTTVAAALALALAQRGHRVLLSTTDPAAHVAATVGKPPPNLTVERIDPELEVSRYREDVMAKAGQGLEADALALLEEDLRSPCTEEIAVFRAFAKTVDAGREAFVVLDTAPTGHSILLLDTALAYHREVMRVSGDMPAPVRELLPRLRDPAYTRLLIVTLAEATPVHEAERLQQDLARAGIRPFAWVINQSLAASGTVHPLLVAKGQYELPFIERVAGELSPRCHLIPWLAEPPVGLAGLAKLINLNPE